MPVLKETATKTVTVVDDEPVALDVLVRAARSWQYECQAASTAEQALRLMERRPTPIVVTDLRMPGRGGIWLVREIQRRWPQTGIIVVTAGDDDEAAMECLNAGADRYFLKPIKLEEFHHALETTLHTYLLERERECYRHQLERTVHRQTKRIRRNFLSTIDSLVRTVEERDPYTAGHSLRVRDYALRLARALGLERKQLSQVSLAAKLHDIGKFGIPEVILNKPGPLTRAEESLIREHPAISERIVAPIIRSKEVLAAIRGHHERIDGTGYPDGRTGNSISKLARIITIADCFDAMTSTRAYRAALPRQQALEYLCQGAGAQFEPEFVQVFVQVASEIPPEPETWN